MILPDVNVLVAAFRPDAAAHAVCHGWLHRAIGNEPRFAVTRIVLSAVVRISTNNRIFDPPSTQEDVINFCEYLLAQPNCVQAEPGPRHWSLFAQLCIASRATGNLVTDAWIAAIAIEWGCEVITFDKDFSRFRDLRQRPPR